jgi:carbon monoxide dehydrogenase subunit G
MAAGVSVTQERLIRTTPDNVWSVITAPEMHERLDSRCALGPVNGNVGSDYELVVRAGASKARLRYRIREVAIERRWAADVERGGKSAGTQEADLSPEGQATLLRWTVTLPTTRLTRRLVAASCDRELKQWLAAVERESLARVI